MLHVRHRRNPLVVRGLLEELRVVVEHGRHHAPYGTHDGAWGVLYLRHRKLDSRIVPGPLITGWLWVCAIVLAVVSPGGVLIALAIQAGWLSFG